MSDAGSIMTVEGLIDPEELGTTLTHEHTFMDMVPAWFEKPDTPFERKLSREPVTMENRGHISLYSAANKDNMRLESLEEAIDEISRFYRAGGDSIVDVTPKDAGSDPKRVRAVARETGVQVVQGTAYYVRRSHSDHVDNSTLEDLTEEFTSDIRDGIDDTEIRAGLIGEIGVSGTVHPQEEKVLRAGARAAKRTGASVNIHPPIFAESPVTETAHGCLDIVEDEGLPLDRVILSHMDNNQIGIGNLENYSALADRGAHLEFDLWGFDIYDKVRGHFYPSDASRVEIVKEIIDAGYLSHLLFSHDICNKIQRVTYGGHGYAYILEVVVSMLEEREVSRSEINRILVDNPRKALTFEEPIH